MKEMIERLKRDREVVIQTLKALDTNHEAKRLSTASFEFIRGGMERELLHIDEILWTHGESTSE
jgi:hypothetical protein